MNPNNRIERLTRARLAAKKLPPQPTELERVEQEIELMQQVDEDRMGDGYQPIGFSPVQRSQRLTELREAENPKIELTPLEKIEREVNAKLAVRKDQELINQRKRRDSTADRARRLTQLRLSVKEEGEGE